jgi:alkaline phosphatase
MPISYVLLLTAALAGCGDGDHAADLGGGGDLSVGGDPDLGTGSDDGGGPPCAYDEASDGTAHLLGLYTLPPTSMRVLNPYLTQADLDAAISHGAMTTDDPGFGSGLEYGGGCPGTFYTITDRGPNGDRTAGDGKTFPLPTFTPTIATLHGDFASSALVIDAVLPLRNNADAPVTGLSNDANDDAPWLDDQATTQLPYDADGLDTEDLRRLPNGDYAFGDEYSPSVGIVDGATGHVKVRYVPSTVTSTAHYPVAAILPAVLTNRRLNKGFEGVALSPDGHTAWALLQTPMGDDGNSSDGPSLVDRVIRIDHFDDPTQAIVGGHYIVLHQAAAALLAGGAQKDVFYNSAAYLAPDKLVIIERMSNPTAGLPGHLTLVVADFTNATNLVGHPELGEGTLDPEKPSPPGYVALGITPATTTVVFDSNDVPAFLQSPPGGAVTPDKLEGLAVINRTTVAIAADNDFGILDVADHSRIWVLRTKAPMY